MTSISSKVGQIANQIIPQSRQDLLTHMEIQDRIKARIQKQIFFASLVRLGSKEGSPFLVHPGTKEDFPSLVHPSSQVDSL